MGLRIKMNDHYETGPGAVGQGIKQTLQRLHTAGRGADTDYSGAAISGAVVFAVWHPSHITGLIQGKIDSPRDELPRWFVIREDPENGDPAPSLVDTCSWSNSPGMIQGEGP